MYGEESNSISVIVYHISVNLKSRFTDFLTSNGEKTSRNRDTEFKERDLSRNELIRQWNAGWNVLLNTLNELTDSDLEKIITIRGKDLMVAEALHRSLAHLSYLVG